MTNDIFCVTYKHVSKPKGIEMASFEYAYKRSDYIVIDYKGVHRNDKPLTEYHGMQFDENDIRDIMGCFLNKISLNFSLVAELRVMISRDVPCYGKIIMPNPDLSQMKFSNNYAHCEVCFSIKDTSGIEGYWVDPLNATILYQEKDNNFYNTKQGFKKDKFVDIVKNFIVELQALPDCQKALFLLSEGHKKTK